MDIKAFLHRHSSTLIAIFFVLMGFVSIFILASTHLVYYNTDLVFHWYRLNELHFDILLHALPQFDTHSTTPYGLATMTYYPYEILLPFSFLTFFIKNPITLIYTLYFLIITIMYFISYYSYKTIRNSKFHALIFAIFYSSSSIFYSYMIQSGDIGVLLAMMFLPIAFFGMFNLIDHGKWIMLSIGLTMVIFSHILSAILLIGLLVVMTILNLKDFLHVKQIGKLIMSIILSLITTSLFWAPLLYNMKLNPINSPEQYPIFSEGLVSQFSSTINFAYGLVEIFGVLTIIFVKKMNWHDFQLWIIGVLCLLINVKFIGDILLHILPQLISFQFARRFSFIAHIIFAYLLAKFITQQLHNSKSNYLLVSILVPIVLFSSISNQLNTRFLLGTRHVTDERHSANPAAKSPFKRQMNENSHSFNLLKHAHYNLDYAPKKAVINDWMFIQQKTITLNKHHIFQGFEPYKGTDNGIKMYLKRNANFLILPMIEYHGYQYDVIVNGKRLPTSRLDNQYTKENALVSVKNVPAGHYTFQLEPKVPYIVNNAFYATLIGVLIHIVLLIWKGIRFLIKKKNKNKNNIKVKEI